MIQDWQLYEAQEQISQGVLLLKKFRNNPNDEVLQKVVDNYIHEHRAYLPDEPKGYDISKLDWKPENLNF